MNFYRNNFKMNIINPKDDILEYYHIQLEDYKYNLVVSGGMVIESLNLRKTNWVQNNNYFNRHLQPILKIKN